MTQRFAQQHQAWMARALALSDAGRYTADPNPLVGCVIVRNGRETGSGAHLRAGQPHAEIHALEAAGSRARGADVYVTLEPCAHHGRTGPCADALIAAGVARVFCALEDPNPLVAGQGIGRLEAAGIAVVSGLCAEEAERRNAGFLMRHRSGRPRVLVKSAMSLDGRTALADGESRWISGPDSRAEVHRQRALASAVVTGIGTVLRDDPRLTARLDEPVSQPLRVVLDGELRCPPTARVIGTDGRALILTRAAVAGDERCAALQAAGATVQSVAWGPRGAEPAAVLATLAERECNQVLIEAGATLSGSWLASPLVDQWLLYVAPSLLGPAGLPLAAIEPVTSMIARPTWHIESLVRRGEDLELTLVPRSGAGGG